MSRTLPFHTIKRGAPHVFHNNDECDEGRRVEPVNWRAGDGNLSLCQECARRNAVAQRAAARTPPGFSGAQPA